MLIFSCRTSELLSPIPLLKIENYIGFQGAPNNKFQPFIANASHAPISNADFRITLGNMLARTFPLMILSPATDFTFVSRVSMLSSRDIEKGFATDKEEISRWKS